MLRIPAEPLSRRRTLLLLTGTALAGAAAGLRIPDVAAGDDPLPSWNDGPSKQAILAFVADVKRLGAPSFVPAPERIAVLDNDGTLWAEQPIYIQAQFAVDRIRELAPQHPE